MTGVELRQIAQSFDGKPVLGDISLRIESGQYVVLLGPSGCGKTTLLRIIAGLQKPDGGNVLFDNRVVDRIPPRRRNVSMVFQREGLYPHQTIAKTLRFALSSKLNAEEVDARIGDAIRLARIDGILDRFPSRLSGGELRRAAVAKAIARRASVRLLDEPLSALDAPIRHALQTDILEWHREVPGTTIHVTHDGQEAMRMADRIAVIEDGRIVQMASPGDVYAKPMTNSAATAIGSPPMNLVTAKVSRGEIAPYDSALSLSLGVSTRLPDGEILVGVRPEAFQLSDDDRACACLNIHVKLQSIRRVERSIHLSLLSENREYSAIVAGDSDLTSQLQIGDTLRLSAALDDVHLFDAQSGQRIEPKNV